MLLEAFGDADHFGVGLLAGDAGFETAEGEDAGMPVAIVGKRVCPRSERKKNVGGLEELKAARENADDGVGARVEIDGLAEDFRGAAEAALPQAVAEDDRPGVPPARSSSARKVRPSMGVDAEQGEKAGRGHLRR